MSYRNYPSGIDCVWIAIDHAGNVGAFVTGGGGPIPLQALNSEMIPIESIEELIIELPSVSDTHLLISIQRPDDFIAMAERGIFVYDWSDVHRTENQHTHVYEQVAVPLNPIKVDFLSKNLSNFASSIVFNNLLFLGKTSIDVCAEMICHEEK